MIKLLNGRLFIKFGDRCCNTYSACNTQRTKKISGV
ncbi:hypothetical protein EMIT0P201_50252 [Pseudomonas chlororaphis]